MTHTKTVVAFIHVEPRDVTDGSAAETKLVKNAKWLARKMGYPAGYPALVYPSGGRKGRARRCQGLDRTGATTIGERRIRSGADALRVFQRSLHRGARPSPGENLQGILTICPSGQVTRTIPSACKCPASRRRKKGISFPGPLHHSS